ncbi:MAG: molybdopterin molybdotransferase MoeA [Acidobacteria bacterium]|nr:molybdopterin molybdotransferase MoeA [Acidobacteriota bacterium]
MIPVPEAIRIVLEQARSLASERIALEGALGRVLAGDVLADGDLPPFDRAQMDGYAVRAADTAGAPVRLRLVGEAAAGEGWRGEMGAGEAVRIMTGAPLPAGADSVQQVEVTRELEDGAVVEIERPTQPGQFFVTRGSEIKAGEIVLRAGEVVGAAGVAVLASFGYAEVEAYRRPRVAVLATGSELVAAAERPGADQIRDSNTYSLAAYAALAGAEVERLPLNLFARTALRAMQGSKAPSLVEERAVLSRPLKGAAERTSYLPAVLETDADGRLIAEPLKWGGSSDFVAFARATALVIVPADVKLIEQGEVVSVVRLPGWSSAPVIEYESG